MRNAFQFFSYSNLITALSATGFALFSFLVLGLENLLIPSLCLVFFSTWFTYLFHRKISHHIHGNLNKTEQDRWHKRNDLLGSIFLLIGFSGALLSFINLPSEVGYVLLPLGIISLAYNLDFQKHKLFVPLRRIPYLKAFFISFSWGLAACFIPYSANFYSNDIEINQLVFLAFGHFFFVFGQVIHFDARDRLLDREEGLKTLAHVFSKKDLIRMSLFSYSASILFILMLSNSTIIHAIALGLGLAISFLIIAKSRKGRSDLYYSFLLELSLAFPCLLLFVLQSMNLEQYL